MNSAEVEQTLLNDGLVAIVRGEFSVSEQEAIAEALLVGGVPVDRLAERVGSTPFFAYDRAMITERVAAVKAALPERASLAYAVKANPMPAVVQHLAGLVDHLDVASAGELAVALERQGRHALVLGFSGASAQTLRTIVDPQAGLDHNIAFEDLDWVEDQIDSDYAVKKVSTYLAQGDLSLKSALDSIGTAFIRT